MQGVKNGTITAANANVTINADINDINNAIAAANFTISTIATGVAGGTLTLGADDLSYVSYLVNKAVGGIVRTIVGVIRVLGTSA